MIFLGIINIHSASKLFNKYRIVNNWNELRQKVVNFKIINEFKAKLDERIYLMEVESAVKVSLSHTHWFISSHSYYY